MHHSFAASTGAFGGADVHGSASSEFAPWAVSGYSPPCRDREVNTFIDDVAEEFDGGFGFDLRRAAGLPVGSDIFESAAGGIPPPMPLHAGGGLEGLAGAAREGRLLQGLLYPSHDFDEQRWAQDPLAQQQQQHQWQQQKQPFWPMPQEQPPLPQFQQPDVDRHSQQQAAPKPLAGPHVVPLESRQPECSVGSATHLVGECKPCAWFWRPQGCSNGFECRHCHLCPSGEVRARRKHKLSMSRKGKPTPPAGIMMQDHQPPF